MQKGIIKPQRETFIEASYSVVGGKEHNGPLGKYFDEFCEDNKFGKDSWEKAESEMQLRALKGAMKRGGLTDGDIDLLLAGDLLNQCVGSNYGLIDFDIPYLGLYGACSTCAEGLGIGACLYGSGCVERCSAVTSSHFCSSERQFRFPLEYGGQRPPTAQWTCTASGAFIIGGSGTVKINEVLFGKTVDKGISDIGNMGAAMAPSAIDTIKRYFNESQYCPADFDMIITGDLGFEGSEIIKDLLLGDGIDITKNHYDCGLLIFDRERDDVHAGGSGCGCCASVLSSYILPMLSDGSVKRVLFMGTGALMSPMSLFQGGSIPGVCHLLHLSSRG